MPKEIEVKSVLNKKKQRDSWFLDEYTINMYSSCSFNCIYCYIRGSKYGINLETSLSIKKNALPILEKELAIRAKKNQYGTIVLSSATDPYLPLEKNEELTRRALKLILKYQFPVHIITKSDLIERDFDILHEIDEKAILPTDLQTSLKRGVLISFSFSTTRDEIGRIFEPGATKPTLRIKALKKTVKENFLSGVSLMPLIPYITDTEEELKYTLSTLKEANPNYLLPASITLFGNGISNSKTLVLQAIKKHYPELVTKYATLFNDKGQISISYMNALNEKLTKLLQEYRIPGSILEAAKDKKGLVNQNYLFRE